MTIQLWCMLGGMILPYIWAFSSLPFRAKQFGKPDLNEPRVQGERLEGGGARAVGSQSNAWEALILFSAANVMAYMAGVDPTGSWSLAAMIWLGVRVVHGAAYIAGVPVLRIIAFTVAFGMSFWIAVMALLA